MSAFSRRKFLQSSAAATAASALTKAAAAGLHGKLNVLLIAVDDQNTRLGCYGDRFAKTPNLDALAARGTTFEKAYCQYPLCGPSRASLMTGLAPDTTRIYGNENRLRDTVPDVTTIGQLFRKNGYYSARVGKIYHADNPADIGQDGLDDPATWDYVFNPQGVDHPKEEPEVTNFTPLQTRHDKSGYARLGSTISFYESPSPDRTMTDSLGADETIRLLREKRNQPFFVAYGLYRPHVPWIVPKAYFDMFPLENIKAKPLDEEELHQAPAPAYTTHPPNFGMTDLQCRQAIRAYYASSAFMDAQAGRVLSELRSLGLEKNTVVVFWGDHGWSLGEHGQWEKQTVFESAAHVPLIFAGPGTNSGKVCTRTVEHLDIFPTLAALCGLKAVPPTLQGQSLTPLLKDSKSPWSKPAISQVTRPPAPDPKTIGYSIRDERYRYTSWQGAAAGEELYDYDVDPEEKRNIAADPSMAIVKTQLKQQLASVTASRGRKIELGAMLPPTAKEDKGRSREEP